MVVVGGGWFTVDVVGGLKPRVIPGPGKVGASAACEAAASPHGAVESTEHEAATEDVAVIHYQRKPLKLL